MPPDTADASTLAVDQVSVHFGGVAALSGVTLRAEAGMVTGLIGPNGAGKTTLFNVITGLQRPNGGFARGAAAEVGTCDKDFRLPIGLAIQDEIRVFRAVGQIAQRTERPFSEAAAN